MLNYKLSLKILLCFIFVSFSVSISAQVKMTDSLENELRLHPEADTVRVNIIIALCKAYANKNVDKLKYNSSQLLLLSQKIPFKKGIANGYLYIGISYIKSAKYPLALAHLLKALNVFKEIKNQQGIAFTFHSIGLVKKYEGKYYEAIQYFLKAGNLREELGDKKGAADSYNNIGNTFQNLGGFSESQKYYLKSLKFREELKDSLGIATCYQNMGNTSRESGKLDEAIHYYEKSLGMINPQRDLKTKSKLYANIAITCSIQKKFQKSLSYSLESMKLAEAIDDEEMINLACSCIGDAYLAQKKFDMAIPYYLRSLKLSTDTEGDDIEMLVAVYSGLGNCYENKMDYDKALSNYTSSLKLSEKNDLKTGVMNAYLNFSSLYERLGQDKQALYYNKLYGDIKDKLSNEKSLKETLELNTKYETEKKEKEILLLTKDQQLKDKTLREQSLVRIGLIIGLGLFLILSFLLYNRYRFKQKANILLEKQKELIHQKNIMITDSIDYAKTIQEAILPDTNKLISFFSEHFILYKPKAIVSGDFYWIGKKNDQLICAVADCTGHGVPGAFMSLLGHNILENVIQRESSTNPGAILSDLNEEIVNRFSKGKERETVKHGMDIAIICIDADQQKLQFAGAKNSLYIIRENHLTELKADKQSTGVVSKDHMMINYTNNVYNLQKGDMLYMFSDGFPDQKGGKDKKKFYYQPFKDLLINMSNLALEEQKQQLDSVINNWIGEDEQIDDILVMGIRIT